MTLENRVTKPDAMGAGRWQTILKGDPKSPDHPWTATKWDSSGSYAL